MNISILTLFPGMFTGPFSESVIKRAIDKNLLTIDYINIRDFAVDSYKSVDDHPYGGGVGMILRVDVVDRALISAKGPTIKHKKQRTILLDPQGTPYTQTHAERLTQYDHLILICGHYEGIDDRIRDLVDEELSIGDYVLTGGEIPAIVVADSVARLIPGVLREKATTENESFGGEAGILEYPQYTRPEEYKGMRVPSTLLSGNHKEIARWRSNEARERTKKRRPDLLRIKNR